MKFNIAHKCALGCIGLALLLFWIQSNVAKGADEPPSAVTAQNLCTINVATNLPVADMSSAHSIPLLPWRTTQPYNPADGHPQVAEFWSESLQKNEERYGHNGEDLGGSTKGAPGSENIYAAIEGRVIASTSDASGWGNSIVIASRVNEYSNAIVTTHYHHLHDRYVGAVCGEDVAKGQLIGTEGKTGSPKYPVHLHFTVRHWANVEHLNNWIPAGGYGSALFGPGAYFGIDGPRFKGSYEAITAWQEPNASSPYYYYGHLDPAPLIWDYFVDYGDGYVDPQAPHAWAIEYVKKMRYYGIEMGGWDGRFGITQPVKRREAARWLKIALEGRFDGYVTDEQLFDDVPLNDPDRKYIHALTTFPTWSDTTVIDSANVSSFRPDDELNRAEALKMMILANYSQPFNVFLKWWMENREDFDFYTQLVSWTCTDLYFVDVDLMAWYAPYVYFGAIEDCNAGFSAGLVTLDVLHQDFEAEEPVHRAHMAKWIITGYEFLHGEEASDPCADVSCESDQLCDPSSGDCVDLSECIPDENNPCPSGGPQDPPNCGDMICDLDEDCSICPTDCGPCDPACGDAMCNGMEDCETCPQDCGECPNGCPDDVCGPDESCEICPQDCGFCAPECGDDECNGDEDCDSCSQDCGGCPPMCGDNQCNGNEDCDNCPEDCGDCGPMCGDNACEGNEDCNSCPEDCGNCVCADNEVDEDACDPGTYCPPGVQERVCNNDSWGPWGSCESNLSLKFHGDGGERCGPIVCLQISGVGNDSSLSATVSKADNGVFANDIYLVIFQPSSNDVIQYGCVSTTGLSSYNFQIPLNSLDISLGDTIAVNAQAGSPCVNGANYISDDAYISQCSSN